ncbi:MAG: hypothetical protein C0611_01445 [Desulfobacteraceae bacterium]|nr:MAG: hypothetical protein C0611_01445 [Desulfobacteraceae bacterium]
MNINHQYLSSYGIDGVNGKKYKAYGKKDKSEIHQTNVILLPIRWEKGFQGSRIQGFECMFSDCFIKAFFFWKCFCCLKNLQFEDDPLMLIEN